VQGSPSGAGDATADSDTPRYIPRDPSFQAGSSGTGFNPPKAASVRPDPTAECATPVVEASWSTTLHLEKNLRKDGDTEASVDTEEVEPSDAVARRDEAATPSRRKRGKHRQRRHSKTLSKEVSAASPEAWRALNEVRLPHISADIRGCVFSTSAEARESLRSAAVV
jgi:hypothetical protein